MRFIGVIKVFFRKYFILLFLLLMTAVSFQVSAEAGNPGTDAVAGNDGLVDNGGYAVKKNGKYILTHNLHTTYMPASVIKIATALAALDVLDPSFRFETALYRDTHNNLFIKGYGDPFLVSEEVVIIIRKLKELGWTEINDIYLDNTAFNLEKSADGSGLSDNPYDAQNSALAVNFNTVNIEIHETDRVVSAEEQTPTLQLMAKLAAGFKPGVHRINISKDKTNGDIIINRYVGELFRAFQKQENIAGTGIIAAHEVPADLEPFYIHRSSKTLEDIIGPLLLYSNNFIANQLFLVLGTNKFGYPATWEKSIQVMSDILQNKFNLSENEIKIVEGSGLSRKNRVSPHAMIKLLDAFKPYAELLPQEEGRLLKSGTLRGIYSYAGYFVENERLDSFVLLLNQEKNNRDRVLEVLELRYRANEDKF